MDREGLLDSWRKRLAGFAPSGLSVRRWCDLQGISLNQYYYWNRRLAQADQNTPIKQNTPAPGWLAVGRLEETPLPSTPGGVSIRIAGAAIELEPGFDPALLRAVVRALAAERC